MAYKVSLTTLAIIGPDKVGNIPQFDDVVYTETPIELIPPKLQDYYKNYKGGYFPVIKVIEEVKGICL